MLLPTTRAQVTGHKFLTRRVHHGLVFGDIRMIHDPLAARHRAGIFGVVATALVAAGAGLFAMLDASPDPGDAPIVAAESGALYVRVDGVLHPVANLASARLIAGEPATPVAIDRELLAQAPQGRPVGLADAPGAIASAPPPQRALAACLAPEATLVVAGPTPQALRPEQAALLIDATGTEHLVTAEGAAALPAADSPAGRVLRRRAGIDADTPRWEATTAEALAAFPALPALRAPEPLPALVATDAGWWVEQDGGDGGDGGESRAVTPITDTQAEILLDLGAISRRAPREEIAGLPDAGVRVDLPSRSFEYLSPPGEAGEAGEAGQMLCSTGGSSASAGESATVGLLDQAALGGVELPPGGFAQRFVAAGGADGAVTVDTGHGFHLLTDYGVRHAATNAAALTALGAPEPIPVAWEVLRLLPAGSPLDAAAARGASPGLTPG